MGTCPHVSFRGIQYTHTHTHTHTERDTERERARETETETERLIIGPYEQEEAAYIGFGSVRALGTVWRHTYIGATVMKARLASAFVSVGRVYIQ